MAGQSVRLIDIHVGNSRYGCFENIYQFESSQKFADYLQQAVARTHGVAGHEFLSRLVREKLTALDFINDQMKRFSDLHSSKNQAAQVGRVLQKFALASAVGELASLWKITSWQEGSSFEACSRMFKKWIEHRGGVHNLEGEQIAQSVKLFFQRFGLSRFVDLDEAYPRTPIDCAGYRRKENEGMCFYMFTEVLKHEFLRNYNKKQVVEVCCANGWLNENGSSTHRLPLQKVTRYYRFTGMHADESEFVTDVTSVTDEIRDEEIGNAS